MKIIVGVSDAKVSNNPGDTLVTYSLGSCIGVALYDAGAGVAGLLHFQLPSATMDVKRAEENPMMFADSGMRRVMSEMQVRGACQKRMKVKLAGGAQMLNDAAMFNIGKRNHASIRKVLWQHGLFVEAESVGGDVPRTMFLSVADGTLTLKCGERTVSL